MKRVPLDKKQHVLFGATGTKDRIAKGVSSQGLPARGLGLHKRREAERGRRNGDRTGSPARSLTATGIHPCSSSHTRSVAVLQRSNRRGSVIKINVKTAGRTAKKSLIGGWLAVPPRGRSPRAAPAAPSAKLPPQLANPAIPGRTRVLWGPLSEGGTLAPLSGVSNRRDFLRSIWARHESFRGIPRTRAQRLSASPNRSHFFGSRAALILYLCSTPFGITESITTRGRRNR